jgi:hypothetical protein
MIQCQTVSGSPVTVGDITLTPQSQALTIRWPSGGWVWNRPVAILVERGQQATRVPIVDVTRALQLGLLSLSVVLGIVTFALMIGQGRDRNG